MKNTKLDLAQLRRQFHSKAELSGQEQRTSEDVIDILSGQHPDRILTKLGGYGVAAIFRGVAPGPTVLFRCELDALPIKEINTFAHRSGTEGVSHKCGHDGHLTIMLGLAERLSHEPVQKGRVILLFQPSEENGEGAEAVLNDPQFEGLDPDFVFALHNLPGYPLNQVVFRHDSFTAAVNSMIINLKGKTAHAGEPELGINPAHCLTRILQDALTLSNNDPDREDFALVTPVYIHLGDKAYGISAGEAELHLTIRTWTEEHLQTLSDKLASIVQSEARKDGIEIEIGWTQHFSANENNPEAMVYLHAALEKLHNDRAERRYPFKWGEDFGLFTQKFKGAMFGIGSGEECPALHNPDYDFPDEIIDTGVNVFFSLQSIIMNEYDPFHTH